MADLKLPTLQHFVTLCGGSVENIYKRIVHRENDKVVVSYNTLRTKWLFDLIQLGVPYEDIKRACEKIRGEKNREANLAALAALKPYLELVVGTNCVIFDKTYYPIGRGLLVPVNPPLLLIKGSERKVLWVSFWSTRKLTGFVASLFATIMEQSVFLLPDLREFELELVDLSRPEKGHPRSMLIKRRNDFETLDSEMLQLEMDKFVEALQRRMSERAPASEVVKPARSLGLDGLPLFLDRGI